MVLHPKQAAQRQIVYGTLVPGRKYHQFIEQLSGSREPATLRGRLLEEGSGARRDYPGIVPDDSETKVEGFIFSSNKLLRMDKWSH